MGRPPEVGHIVRIHDRVLAIGEVITMPMSDQHANLHDDVTCLVFSEETREAYLAQALERCGEPYTEFTRRQASLPDARFYRVVMD